MDELHARLERVKISLAGLQGQAQMLAKQGAQALAEAQEHEALAKSLEEACVVISKYSDLRQGQIRDLIEGMITKGLTEVFEEPLQFHVRTKTVGQRTDTYFTLSSMMGTTEVETDIMSARGGGVAAVTGFLLRVVLAILHKAPRIFFLDESFAQVSENYEPQLAEFIDTLCAEYGVRIVLVTHSTNPVWVDVADAVYRSSMVKGETVLEKVK